MRPRACCASRSRQLLDDGGVRAGVHPTWTLAERLAVVEPGARSRARALRRAATDAEGALAQRLASLSRVAFGLRDRMSVDHWRTLNRLLADPALQREPALPMTLVWLDRAVTSLMTLSGFVLDGMTRGIGWRFVSIGRRVERLATMCAALAGGDRARAARTSSTGCSSSPTRA